MRARSPLVIAVLAICCVSPVAAQAAADPRFLVPVSAATPATIGGFSEADYSGDAGAGLRAAFGTPTSASRKNRFSCVLRWSSIGLWVELTNYGQPRHPCFHGYFVRARLLGSRWHTPKGLRIGHGAALARSQSVCGLGRLRCRTSQYYATGSILGVHRIDCAPGLFPNVIAAIQRGRVVSFWVYSHGCE